MSQRDARRLVVFDFDGTLADTWRDIAAALNRTLDDAGLRAVEGPEVRFWIGAGVLPLLARAVPPSHQDPAQLEALYERFRIHYEQCCLDTTDLYPGISECLEALAAAPSTLAIASNKPARFLERIVDGLAIKRFFRVVVAGDSIPFRKPDPRVLHYLLAQLEAAPDEVWVVGDSAIDAELGRLAGARTIGCGWGLRGRAELREAGVDHLLEHPSEIPRVVLAG